ncbi:hypothetical protein K443DRAFT_680560, partial [Laccaria amethystina LaAM-08-1]
MNFPHLAAINLKHNETQVRASIDQALLPRQKFRLSTAHSDPCGEGEGNSGDRHLAAHLMPGVGQRF